MKIRTSFSTIAGAAALLLTPAALLAQTTTTTPPPPAHHGLAGLMAKLHAMPPHRPAPPSSPAAPGGRQVARAPFVSGQIIGDKKSHVFHLPGAGGTLPAPQNRVYFRTAAQAQAAGYRQAGSPSGGKRRIVAQRGTAHPAPVTR